MAHPDLLFVLGLGRSGTTALTDLLTAHPRIALGIERYKRLYLRRRAQIPRDLFEHDRFFDFSDDLTNITPESHERWATHYRKMEEKWDQAAYVGDKLTSARLQLIWRSLPEARFVCIVRDIDQVAASWDKRAHNTEDKGWSARHDAREAVSHWNEALRRIRRAVKERPQHAVVVEYSRMFGDPDGASLASVLGWLGLELEPAVDAQFAYAHQRYVDAIAPKDRALSPEVTNYLRETADRAVWRQLVRRAV